MPNNLYYFLLNIYLDSKDLWELCKICRLYKEVKSVFFFSAPRYQSCCFQNEKYASPFCVKTENPTSVVEQKLIKVPTWFSHILMHGFNSFGV